jgi:hypothetical protein
MAGSPEIWQFDAFKAAMLPYQLIGPVDALFPGGKNDVASCNEFCYVAMRNSSKYAVRYPLNGTVTVHYHPTKPELAVLETQFDSSALLPLGGMLFSASFAFWVFCLGGGFARALAGGDRPRSGFRAPALPYLLTSAATP